MMIWMLIATFATFRILSRILAYVFDDNIFVKMSARLSSVRTLMVIVNPSF